MILSFHPCIVADVQIILGDRTLNSNDYELIRDAEAVILPQSCSYDFYQACRDACPLLFPNYDVRFRYPGKIGQSLLFEELHCPHPETKQWYSVEEFKEVHSRRKELPHGIPFLIKADRSHEAEGIFLIDNQVALESSLENLILLEKSGFSGFVSQALIRSGGNVLRVVILGKKMQSYWKRPMQPGTLVTTIRHGAKIDRRWKTDLQRKGRREARDFSSATGMNLAALDFIFALTESAPCPLFLEVNYYFGRRGLGGSLNYYRLLYEALQEWLKENGLDHHSVELV